MLEGSVVLSDVEVLYFQWRPRQMQPAFPHGTGRRNAAFSYMFYKYNCIISVLKESDGIFKKE